MPSTKKGGYSEMSNLALPFGLLLAKESLMQLSKGRKVSKGKKASNKTESRRSTVGGLKKSKATNGGANKNVVQQEVVEQQVLQGGLRKSKAKSGGARNKARKVTK